MSPNFRTAAGNRATASSSAPQACDHLPWGELRMLVLPTGF
jgi:hypothetical protein